jgi:dipeptidyl aminopeptidase/acylaminoacyl peptidase
VGISESGNHDNRNYEDDWGVRYIGLEVIDTRGRSNYALQANQVHAKNLKGKLFLIHGGMDDNVPPYNISCMQYRGIQDDHLPGLDR